MPHQSLSASPVKVNQGPHEWDVRKERAVPTQIHIRREFFPRFGFSAKMSSRDLVAGCIWQPSTHSCGIVTVTQVTRMSSKEVSPEAMTVVKDESFEPEGPATVWTASAAHFTRWCDGESSALDDLVKVMTPVLWHVVRSYRLPHDVAEDVIQTTWLALVRRREAILDGAAVGGWLTTTARREAWRVSKTDSRVTPTEDESIAVRLPRQRSAEQAAVLNDEQARLWAAVLTLDDRCQRLLRIVAFEHRPDYGRVAEQLEMPVGSIGPTRGRCLAKLKSALMAAQFSEELT